ncbi:MAG TPA: aminotransferase class V-fold PLP-dependent enzyme [Methylophilaceae bacterium]|nr:aminotransferase class V-fold PLP-dependent enzyme [Methylophilaceae bacterium]
MQFKFSDGKELRKHWMLEEDMHFLNHGSFGAAPRVVLQAQQRFRDRMERQPVDFLVRQAPAELRAAAGDLAGFLGAQGEDLAFVENATAGVNAVLRSYPWQAGDELLLSVHAYPAVKHLTRFVARQSGIVIREFDFAFPLKEGEILENFSAAVTSATRMAIIDHVSSPLAIVYPLQEMLAVCRAKGVRTLVDGAHAPGMLALDIPALQVDWYVGNCHKWLFAPKGCAFLWAAPGSRDFLQPPVVSLRMEDGFPATFDWVGTRDPSPWLSISAAIAFYREMGGSEIPAYLHQNLLAASQLLQETWQVESPAAQQQLGTMATLPLPLSGEATLERANQIRDQLWREHRIEVPLFAFDGRLWVRISAQLYNVIDDYVALAAAVKRLTSHRA